MRAALLIGVVLLTFGLAACGGSSDESAAPPAVIVEAEPEVESFAGQPLAMVFFHPL
jgi:hypothetical protein